MTATQQHEFRNLPDPTSAENASALHYFAAVARVFTMKAYGSC